MNHRNILSIITLIAALLTLLPAHAQTRPPLPAKRTLSGLSAADKYSIIQGEAPFELTELPIEYLKGFQLSNLYNKVNVDWYLVFPEEIIGSDNVATTIKEHLTSLISDGKTPQDTGFANTLMQRHAIRFNPDKDLSGSFSGKLSDYTDDGEDNFAPEIRGHNLYLIPSYCNDDIIQFKFTEGYWEALMTYLTLSDVLIFDRKDGRLITEKEIFPNGLDNIIPIMENIMTKYEGKDFFWVQNEIHRYAFDKDGMVIYFEYNDCGPGSSYIAVHIPYEKLRPHMNPDFYDRLTNGQNWVDMSLSLNPIEYNNPEHLY